MSNFETMAGMDITGENKQFEMLLDVNVKEVKLTGSTLYTTNPKYFIPVTTPDNPNGSMVIENPFPYNFRGVVAAVSKEVAESTNIKPGDYVELDWVNIKESRYYPDKTKTDQVTLNSPEAPNYEGYVKVKDYSVEALVQRKEFKNAFGVSMEEYWSGNEEMKLDVEQYTERVSDSIEFASKVKSLKS